MQIFLTMPPESLSDYIRENRSPLPEWTQLGRLWREVWGAECWGVCESCEIRFRAFPLPSRRSAQFLSSCTHSISHSWVTSSHLFLSDAIILANVMRGWLSFWRFLSSLFLLDWHDNKYLFPICRASVPIASFYGALLIFSWEQPSRKARELKFGSSSVFLGWQQEIHPNSVVWVLNLSSYRVYHVKQSLTIFSAASYSLCWINTSSAI